MFGNGVIGPFLIIYLHNVRGISLGIAGLVVASNSAAGLVSGFVGGALSDRLGPRRVLSAALVLMAVAFALFPLIRAPWQAFGLNVLVGLGSGSFWPSQSTLLSSLTPKERRHAAFAQQRMTMNLGIALGGLVAGAIARTAHPGTFTFLFLLNAATFLVFVAVLRLVPAPRHVEAHHEPGRYIDVLRNGVFLRFIVLNVIFIGAGIAVMSELLPPFAKNVAHVSEPAIGVLWFVFAGGVALGQLPIVKLVEGKSRMRGLALMGVVWAGTFIAVLLGGTWFTGTQAAIVFGIAVAVGNSISVGIVRTPGSIAAILPNAWLFIAVWIGGAFYALLSAFQLAELGTLTRNTIRLPAGGATFDKDTQPSALQARALDLAATAPVTT